MARTLHERRKRSRKNLWHKQKGHCFYCGDYVAPEKATLDHINPLGNGGDDRQENHLMACKICNEERANRHHKEYWKYLKPYREGLCNREELEFIYNPIK